LDSPEKPRTLATVLVNIPTFWQNETKTVNIFKGQQWPPSRLFIFELAYGRFHWAHTHRPARVGSRGAQLKAS
jgi:hypothetical protein